MTEDEKEFFELIRADDIFGLTAMINADQNLVNAVNDSGISALLAAAYHGRKEVMILLVKSGARIGLFEAAAMGDVKRLRALIEDDPTGLRRQSPDGWTPLHLAAFFGHKEAVQLLLDMGAPVDMRSANALNNLPLHAAAAGGSREVVAVLLAGGADVNAAQGGGWTALHAAAQRGDAEMVKLLLGAGAVPRLSDSGESPLDLARKREAHAVVALLQESPLIH